MTGWSMLEVDGSLGRNYCGEKRSQLYHLLTLYE